MRRARCPVRGCGRRARSHVRLAVLADPASNVGPETRRRQYPYPLSPWRECIVMMCEEHGESLLGATVLSYLLPSSSR